MTMYVPRIYKASDRTWLRRVVAQYPFAALISNGPKAPYATHLPVICAPCAPSESEDLEGSTLFGHMNRANPHWDSLVDGADAQLIFTGPHGYVTPSVYQRDSVAPTWNYVSVHLRGKLQPVADFEETLKVVQLTVSTYEQKFGSGWEMDSSLDHYRRIGPAVGAFSFEVESADGMFKLSQEQNLETRRRVADHFSANHAGRGKELASFMREYSHGDYNNF
ncbi:MULTISPECIES: FMN-binding negative transcriptional regulator [Nocardiaceae]|nr:MULTISPECIES: FMN-binding negative transcriptional regulator [Rhodococcus]